jgi:ankyrin repeat protein
MAWQTRAQFRRSVLYCAAANGHADCVRLLLNAGVYMDASDFVRPDHRMTVDCILILGSSIMFPVFECEFVEKINSRCDTFGLLLFSLFSFSFRLRFRHNDILTCAQEGSTALSYAVEKNHVECVRLLLDAGADKDAHFTVRVCRRVNVVRVLV